MGSGIVIISYREPGSKGSSPAKSAAKKFSINDFEVVEELSKGAFGVIKLVRRLSNLKPYVLKVIPKQSVKREDHVINERDILNMCKECPFVVDLHETFQDELNLYFLLEYLPGGELATVFRKNRISMQLKGTLMHYIGKIGIRLLNV